MVVTEAIIALAEKLGLEVLAEGVETTDQLDRLRDAGCLMYQGYIFSPPVDIETFEKFLPAGGRKVEHWTQRLSEPQTARQRSAG